MVAIIKPATESDLPGSGSDDEKTRLGKTPYTAMGFLCGLIAFGFLPVVFGPISMFAGVQLYRRHSELLGIAVFAWGMSGLIFGFIFGALLWL